MVIHYVCRHCASTLGKIPWAADENSAMRLGWNNLSEEERRGTFYHNANGDCIVRVVCEYCEQALDEHPELWLVDKPIH